MKRLFFSLCAVGLSCAAFGAGPEVNIVPKPLSVTPGAGTFTVTASTVIGVGKNAELRRSARIFAGEVAPVVGGVMKTAAEGDVRLAVDGSLEAEAYTLAVTPSGVEVRGGTPQGVFHGLQSLRQLVIDGEGVVPAVTVSDKPYFAHRGGMLDPCRHFWTVDEVKEYIDILAMHKLNKFHWHLTDDQGWRIEIKRYPELTAVGSIRKATVVRKEWGTYDGTPYGGFYTQDEIRDVVKYAADRGVTVIPEIDLPGHMLAALTAYPELGCTGGPYEVWGRWGVADDVLCPGREKTFEFLEGVLTEVMELFPSEYIHIGGDECPKVRWEKCPRCQAKIRQLGLKDDGEHTAEHYLQSYVTDRIGKFLARHGRRIIGWDEILEGRAPSDAVVMSWRGSEGGIAAAKLGHDVIMTPNSHFYFDYYQSLDTDAEPFGIGGYIPMEQVYSYDPVFPELTPEQQKHILGVQANLWTEYVLSDEHLEYMLLPRLAALSEVQWCLPETKDWNRFIGSFRMDKIYSQLGYEFAKHIFGVTASYAVDPEKGGVVMTLTTQGGAPIRYTLDGSDPTASSPLYKAPVTIGESCTFKAAALREGMQTPVYTRKFDFNKATGRRIALNAAPTLKYTYGGASLLVDGYRGGPVYSNGAWIGVLNEPLDVTIDMQGAKPYSAVTVESLVEKGEWVFPPSSVGVYLSDDGREFTEAALMSVPQETAGSPDGVKPFKVLFPETSARYLRVVARTVDPIPAWHGAAGQKAHMFVDEIIVE